MQMEGEREGGKEERSASCKGSELKVWRGWEIKEGRDREGEAEEKKKLEERERDEKK